MKRDLETEQQRNLDLSRENLQTMDVKKRLEINLLELSQEFEKYRQTTNDQLCCEQGQVQALQLQIQEIRGRYEDISNQLQSKLVELSDMVNEAERQRLESERQQ